MLEALRISADVPPLVTEKSRIDVDGLEETVTAPTLTELSQVSFIKAYAAHFTIYDGHFMSIYIKRLFRKPVNYWIDLIHLEQTPIRIFKMDRPILWVTLALGLLSAIFFLIAWASANSLFWLSLAVPTVCSALITSLILAQRSKNRIVYCSRYGRVPWCEFLVAKPNRRTLAAFTKVLSNAILETRNHQKDNRQKRLGAELREHRRLREDGVLSENSYRAVKARLLKKHTGTGGATAVSEEL